MEPTPASPEELAKLPLDERARALAEVVDDLEEQLEDTAGQSVPGANPESQPSHSS